MAEKRKFLICGYSDAVPHLERLRVVEMDDAALAELSNHLPKLRYLSIGYHINPAPLANLKQLEFLEMGSDASFAPLSSLDNLKFLLIHSTLDSDRLVEISRIKSLEKLITLRCSLEDVQGFFQCVDQLPNLKEAYLPYNETELIPLGFPLYRLNPIISRRLSFDFGNPDSREAMENPF